MLTQSAFFGGSSVCAAAREVLATDDVLRDLSGCRSELARAATAVARGDTESPSLTAQWMRDNYARIYPMLVQHLTNKMPRSRDLSVIEDHVQTALARMIERDTLAPFLRDGKSVKPSVLRVWAYQSASTELRRWGVDASLRKTRGAKTAREVKAGDSWKVVQSPTTYREVLPDERRRSMGDYLPEEQYNTAEDSPEDAVSRRSQVDLVRRHLTRIGKAHLVSAVDHLLNGGDLSELQGGTAKQLSDVLRELRG